jgi:hypothetical protein
MNTSGLNALLGASARSMIRGHPFFVLELHARDPSRQFTFSETLVGKSLRNK